MKPEKENWKAPGVTGYKKPRLIENVVGARLTDKRIQYYQDRGFYSTEQKQARLKRAQRRQFKNWVEIDGRLVYCPT